MENERKTEDVVIPWHQMRLGAIEYFASRGLAACKKAAENASDRELKGYYEGKAQAFKEILKFFEDE